MTLVALLILAALALVLLVGRDGGSGGEKTVEPPAQEGPATPVRVSGGGAASEPAPPPSGGPPTLTPAIVTADASARHGALVGAVLNWGDGRPVEGAELVFAGPDGRAHSVETGTAGRFELLAPGPGTYRLALITREGFLPFAPDWDESNIELEARSGVRVSGLRYFLSPAIDYTGIIQTAEGEPVAGARVEILGADSGERALAPIRDEYESDARGRFVFHAHDFALLEASHPRHGRGRARVDGGVQTSRKLTITLGEEMPVAATLRGTVIGADEGLPIGGARIVAMAVEPGMPDALRPGATTHTDGAGAFALALEEGRYQLHVSAKGYESSSMPVDAGAGEGVRVELRRGGAVTGRVVDASGEPVAAFEIIARRADRIGGGILASRAVVHPDGAFTLEGLPLGPVDLVAVAHGSAPSEAVRAEADDGQRQVTLTLRRGATVFGRVLDAESMQPLELAKVSVEGRAGGGASPVASAAITDEEGRFEISGLSADMRSLFVAASDHHMRIVSGLPIAEGERVGPIDIELTATEPGEEPKLELAGIGAVLEPADDGLAVRRVIEGGGAADAGLATGDTILAIEGSAVVELGFAASIDRIRGPVGSRVELRVRRASGEEEDIVATRRKIRV